MKLLHDSRKKSQSATEMTIILAGAFTVLIIILVINQDLMINLNSQVEVQKARTALDDLANAATLVYQEGSGAKTKVYITVPNQVVDTYVSGETLQIDLFSSQRPRQVYRTVKFPVIGTIPTQEGNYWITVEAKEGYVVIRYALVGVNPAAFRELASPGTSFSRNISVDNLALESVSVDATYFGDPEFQLIMTNDNFLLSQGDKQNISLNVFVPVGTPAGIYDGRIDIFANTTTSEQNISVDITIEVYANATGSGGGTCFASEGLYMFPTVWDAGLLDLDFLTSKNFFICSTYNTSKLVKLLFTGNGSSYTGLDKNLVVQNSSNSVPPNDCITKTVYINTSGGANGTYETIFSVENDSDLISAAISFEMNDTEDEAPPAITLISPEDGSDVSTFDITFEYSVDDYLSAVASCSLWINDTLNQTNDSITEGTTMTFTIDVLDTGYYSWNITCIDASENSNKGTSEKWHFNVVASDYYHIIPALASEEFYQVNWTQEYFNATDSYYLSAYDDEVSVIEPDYVQFDFPYLGLPDNYVVDSVAFTFVHRDHLEDGKFPAGEEYRHQIHCWDGNTWVNLGTYPITPDEFTWITYYSDIVGVDCINNVDAANQASIRVYFDPSDTPTGNIDIDFAMLLINNVTPVLYPDLWEMGLDIPQPLGFESGLNTTANTFGVGAGDDGWDWAQDVYDTGSVCVDIQYANVALYESLWIIIGDYSCSSSGSGSGAYGIQFEISQAMYDMLSAGGYALLSFDYTIDDHSLDNGDSVWVKARFGNSGGMAYLGTNDGDTFDDADNDIYYMKSPIDRATTTTQDVTSLITGPGTYYIDIGGKVRQWGNGEYAIFKFDNIQLTINP